MVSMMVRPLSDNRPFRASASVNVGLGATLGATFETPMMTELAGRSIELGQARGQSLYELDMDLESELLSLQDQAMDMPQGPDRDALQIRMTEITRQMRQGGTERGRQMAIEEGRVIAPEVLQQQYGHMNLTFNRPMTEEEARIIVDGRREEMIREAIIAAGPQGVVPTIARFGAGVVAMATDPLEVASMFIPVVSQARTAMLIDKFGRVGGRAAVGAIEGFVGSALTEPAYYGLSRELQLDYTMADSLFNIGLGTILGGGIGSVAGVLSRQQSGGPAPDFRVDMDIQPERAPDVAPRMDVETYRAMEAQRQDVAMQRPVAETALRQFVNDTPLTVGEMARQLGYEAAIRDLRAQVRAEVKSPTIAALKRMGGIDPDGNLARELKAQGITSQVAPGLYRKGGIMDGDNIPASERYDGEGFLSQIVGEDAGYLSTAGIIERIQSEAFGRDTSNAARMLEDAERGKRELDRVVDLVKEKGAILYSKEELSDLVAAISRGEDFDDALEQIAIRYDRGPDDYARDAGYDVATDKDASERFDIEPQRSDDELMAELEMIYDGMADDLTPEQRQLVEDADAQARHADDYARAVEMGAMCLAGGRA